nr:Anaerobic glycerol-3-phosphate dehydrogenase subunit A [Klebsiella pneumoniae]
MEGFITITGGKLMTYRLMAEWATDAVCRKLETPPLYHGRSPAARFTGANGKYPAKIISLPPAARLGRLPSRRSHPVRLGDSRQHRSPVCECEAVTAGEVKYAVENLAVNTLLDLRRRTRIGMGTCQGNSAPAALPDCCSALTSPRPRSR